jgi:hypothetical protein
MIIIKVRGQEFKYRGCIDIVRIHNIIHVNAGSYAMDDTTGLPIYKTDVHDYFFITDIESINGQNEEIRDTPKADIFSE